MLLAELLEPERHGLGQAILSRCHASSLERKAVEAGLTTVWRRALEAVEAGHTSPAEVRRVLGFPDSTPGGDR
jgi:type II secretory ATPase GspE/PulE/Tfp pilus assembly ATPase PilB-like protein